MKKLAHRPRTALLCLALLVPFAPASAQKLPLVLFDAQSDVGAVRNPGSAAYDEATQSYTISSAGGGQTHLVWRKMSGDFILRANAAFVDDEGNPHRKLGWIIRTSLDSSSAYVDAAVHGDGYAALQFRRTPGANAEEQQATVTGADVVQLARSGDTYTMSVARNGDTFENRQVSGIDLGDTVYVGLFVSANGPDVVEIARFHNVRIVVPPWEGFTPYRDYLGSNLELLDVATGDRKIIFRHPASIQAPNWTPDGKSLIYNGDGLLYRFDLDSGIPSQIFSGPAQRINNDHVLTFDGKMLGISNSDPDRGNVSLVYTMPVEGGIPKLIVPIGPSYLHGWSPDGKYLAFVGRRNGDFDIYRVPAEGGPEERLTTTPGLDDGPEYSPDGEYIYFNSVRSGTMQIWRMKPDGSDPEQLTADSLNNWFPHVSPDGKQVVFISFPPEVDPSDHPFYKQVYLRIMPADGGTPKVIAYVFGGQGTINVPSWAPDSKRLAFVSNTGMGF